MKTNIKNVLIVLGILFPIVILSLINYQKFGANWSSKGFEILLITSFIATILLLLAYWLEKKKEPLVILHLAKHRNKGILLARELSNFGLSTRIQKIEVSDFENLEYLKERYKIYNSSKLIVLTSKYNLQLNKYKLIASKNKLILPLIINDTISDDFFNENYLNINKIDKNSLYLLSKIIKN